MRWKEPLLLLMVVALVWAWRPAPVFLEGSWVGDHGGALYLEADGRYRSYPRLDGCKTSPVAVHGYWQVEEDRLLLQPLKMEPQEFVFELRGDTLILTRPGLEGDTTLHRRALEELAR
ncbi:MAG: hypothetical protein AB7S38_01490 [Vulcanimicrobiota bacterium]